VISTGHFCHGKAVIKASAFPVSWCIIAGHLQEMFHRENIAESEPLLLV